MHDENDPICFSKNKFFLKNCQKRAPGGPRPPQGPFLDKKYVFDMSRSQSIDPINSSYLNGV
jgi:hypothetical protein